MPGMKSICEDLAEEQKVIDSLVSALDESRWRTPTPAEGWDVRDQITHLAYFDESAALAAGDADAFAERVTEAAGKGPSGFTDSWLAIGRKMDGVEVLAWWRSSRAEMLEALTPLEPKSRLPWFGPPMSALSFATARLMETWSHGQDVVDALDADREPTDRLRHVAHLGVLARLYSYSVRGLQMPDSPVRVELTSPSGETWTWGEAEATEVVRGPAEDFCLVVTQRRHPADTDLVVVGSEAERWISIAQAFAGPPGEGRRPGQFAKRQR
jgi:uncharacterized protein (TIGR03084 family)